MDRRCSQCDDPDVSLLRVVLIGEIIRADDATLYAMADIFASFGLVNFADVEDAPVARPLPPKAFDGGKRLRVVK